MFFFSESEGKPGEIETSQIFADSVNVAIANPPFRGSSIAMFEN